MAAELGIDLRQVKGSGPMGRVIKRDIEAYVQEREKAPDGRPAAAAHAHAVLRADRARSTPSSRSRASARPSASA